MRYPQDFIDRVRDATDIVALVAESVRLTRAGRAFRGLCPFHTEKTPSFHVNPDRQIYHCFGCGAGGNALTFLVEHGKLTFPEAVRHLAERAGIPVPARGDESGVELQTARIHEALAMATAFFQERLAHPAAGRAARDYLESREIGDDLIEEFALGLAPDAWDHLLKHAGERFTPEVLIAAGLVIKKDDGGAYDRFRNRLMVPITGTTGKVIAFGGRALGDDNAKYINSPETPLYHKGEVLFGLSKAREAMRQSDEAILVEGYFDHLRVFGAGFKNVVAVAGTAFTAQQATLLKRHAARVHLVFDGDNAGLTAAWKAAGLALGAGLDPRIVLLPEGEDPDTFVRSHGGETFRILLAAGEDLIGFAAARLLPTLGKEEALRRLVDTIRESPDAIRRRLLIQETAERLRFDEAVLVRAVEQRRPIALRQATPGERREGGASAVPVGDLPLVERSLLAILVENPAILSTLAGLEEGDFDDERSREIFRQLPGLLGSTDPRQRLIDECQGTPRLRIVSQLLDEPTHGGAEAALDCTRKLRDRRLAGEMKRLKADLAEAERLGETDRASRIFERISELSSIRISLTTGA